MDPVDIQRVVASIEFEPSHWLTVEYSGLIGSPAWPTFWKGQLAPLGLSPVHSGSWQVPVAQVTEPDLLSRIALLNLAESGIDGYPDSDGETGPDDDRIDAMLGGYSLFGDAPVPLVCPGCCCDLGDFEYWSACLRLNDNAVNPSSIGHAEFTTTRRGRLLEIDYGSRASSPDDRIRITIGSLERCLASAHADAVAFENRLSDALAHLVSPPSRAGLLSRLLTGLPLP